MKKNLIIFAIILFSFSMISPVIAVENYDRMLFDDGGGSGGGGSSKNIQEAEKKRSNIIENILLDLFSFGDESSINPQTNPQSPIQPTQTQPNNLLPTGVYPSITYHPQVDPSNILNNTGLNYPSSIIANVQKCLQNKGVYQAAASQTGVPWQVLAGIHYTEGSCDPRRSLRSGTPLGQNVVDVGGNCSSQNPGVGKPKALPGGGCGFDNLLDTAVDTGNHLKGKNRIGQNDGIPRTHQELVYALSYYNGGGNQNCLRTRQTIAPYANIPGNCPPQFEGEDDTYVFNKTPDGKHDVMYIRFCDNGKACGEIGRTTPVHQQYGVITVAGALGSI